MKFRRFVFVAALILFSVFVLPMRGQNAAVVRLSYVSGTVQILQNGAVQFPKAVRNMPLFSGYTLETEDDGEAEIEFADGSVARITPNSSLLLTHLEPEGSSASTTFELTAGLGYFELNLGQGQNFLCRVGPGKIQPVANTIFRATLDNQPEVAVFAGSVHLDAGPDSNVIHQGETGHFGADMPAGNALAEAITPDSWDQWNADRDSAIAEQAQTQTAVRDESAAPQDPGWNDLDANGNWYPVADYGNVWVPNGVDADWDPFGYGYWGDYSGYGAVWVSGYPWGWLPYHCGAWNYFQFGWGWVPGGCGLGWSPIVAVWNAPPRYRLPPRPPHPVPMGGGRGIVARGLTVVDRGAASRGPWAAGSSVAGLRSSQPLVNGGTTLRPLPRGPVSNIIVRSRGDGIGMPTTHVGVPVAHVPSAAAPVGARVPSYVTPEHVPAAPRPTYTPPPAPHYEAPHYSPPPAAPSRPH
jgi:hypothetical protein